MGTRHLTMVQLDGEYRIAQYGQWDGYPRGAGGKILEFLNRSDFALEKFKEAVRKNTRWQTPEDVAEMQRQFPNEYMDLDESKRFALTYPELDRDTGSNILGLVYDAERPLALSDATDFASDTLFCEWVWVIDLDAETLEMYSSSHESPVSPKDRFYSMNGPGLVAYYSLNDLPTVEKLIEDADD